MKVGDRVGEGIAHPAARGRGGGRPSRRAAAPAAPAERRRARSPRPHRAAAPGPHPPGCRPAARRGRRAASRPRTPAGPAHASPVRPQGRPRAGRGPRPRHRHRPARPRPPGGRAAVREAGAEPGPAPGRGGVALDLLPWPKVDFARFGPVETRPLSRIRKIAGANLARNWVMIPHVTQFDEADITDLEAFRVRAQRRARAGRAQGDAARLPGEGLRGRAAALPRVQRLARRRQPGAEALLPHRLRRRHAERPGGPGAAGRRPEGRARDRPGARRAGGQGARGQARRRRHAGRHASPSPAWAASAAPPSRPSSTRPRWPSWACRASATRPVWDGARFAPAARCCPLSLSYDHRVIDGAPAARFTTYLAQLLGDMRRAML